MIVASSALATPAVADDQTTCREQSGDIAVEACNRVINSGKYSQDIVAQAYLNRGQEWFLKGKYDEAIADASAAIDLNVGELMFAYANRGNAAGEKGDAEAAIADFTKAISLDPEFTAGYSARGMQYEKINRNELAIADYKAALSLPNKYSDGRWAHEIATERLKKLGAN